MATETSPTLRPEQAERVNRWFNKENPRANLSNLLAILNADGGHFEDRYGTEAAIAKGLQNHFDILAGRAPAYEHLPEKEP